jgi:hypothetical protein
MPDDIEKLNAIADRYHANLEALGDKKIRVFRAIVYEGDAKTVIAQLGRSLGAGDHKFQQGNLLITVIDNGILKIVGE